MANVALALIGSKPLEQRTDGTPERLERAGLGAAQQRLELGKHLLNRVEVRAVRRQVPQLRYQELLDPGHKCMAVDRPVQHQRRQQPVLAQRADKRRGVPVAARRIAQATLASG